MDLYAHRVSWLAPGRFADFRRLFLEQTWGRLEAAGYRPLCLLNPVIGGMAEEVHSFVGHPSWDDWRRGQELITGSADDNGAYREARPPSVPTGHLPPLCGGRWDLAPPRRAGGDGIWRCD